MHGLADTGPPSPEPSSGLAEAVAGLHKRDSREAKPDGYWQDGVWFPSPTERQPCCDRVQPPIGTRSGSKLRLYDHCRSLEHVANLYGVSPIELRRAFHDAGYRIGRVRGVGKYRRRARAAELLGVASLRDRVTGPLHSLRADLLAAVAVVSQRLQGVDQAVREERDPALEVEAFEKSLTDFRVLVLQVRDVAEVERLMAEAEKVLREL